MNLIEAKLFGDREVLIADDDPEIQHALRALFEREGISSLPAVSTGREAIAEALERQPAAIVLDIELADEWDGVAVAQELAGKTSSLIIYLSGTSDRATIAEARETIPLAYLTKPVKERELLALVHGAFRYRECLRAGGCFTEPGIELITICAWCRRVRAKGSLWTPLAEFLVGAPVRRFTHGICRECMQREIAGVKRGGLRGNTRSNIRFATD